jgi:hypothetical protein
MEATVLTKHDYKELALVIKGASVRVMGENRTLIDKEELVENLITYLFRDNARFDSVEFKKELYK